MTGRSWIQCKESKRRGLKRGLNRSRCSHSGGSPERSDSCIFSVGFRRARYQHASEIRCLILDRLAATLFDVDLNRA